MSDKHYDVFFDPWELEVSKSGSLQRWSWSKLHIIEFLYDDETETDKAWRRVDEKGNTISEPMEWDDVFRLDHVSDDDFFETPRKALNRFEDWLEEHLAWVEDVPETRWHPAEYICIGIIGCVDDGSDY